MPKGIYIRKNLNHSDFNNPNWKGGTWKICPVCGGKKDFNAKTCSDCYIRKGNKNSYFGKNNSNYKNPDNRITPLNQSIRNFEKYSEWRILIFQRDLFICQACKKKSEGDLNAHHIKKLSSILEENKIKTIEQALECDAIWNISNGITLCESCHNLIHKGE